VEKSGFPKRTSGRAVIGRRVLTAVVAMIAALAMAMAPTPASAATGGPGIGKGSAQPAQTASFTLTLTPKRAGGGMTPAFTVGGGAFLCTLNASSEFDSSTGRNTVTGFVYCSAILDGIYFDFYWFKHNTSTLLKYEPSVPDHDTNSSLATSEYDSYLYLDVHVCAYGYKAGYTSGGACTWLVGI